MILANLVDAITDPATILMTFLMILGVLLIIIILLQKGRGGGLAGAFGGSGGQSALGTKAGDIFTKITIVMAFIWVILAGVAGITTRASSGKFEGGSDAVSKEPALTNPDKLPESDPLDKDKKEDSPFNNIEEKKETTTEAAKKADEKPTAEKPAAADKKTKPAKPVETAKPAEKKAEPAATKPDTTKSEKTPK